MERNSDFNHELGVKAWTRILGGLSLAKIQSVLDCGSNLGRNIEFLKDSRLLPEAKYSALDLNNEALKRLQVRFPDTSTIHTDILDFEPTQKYDLVFTSGVLIHLDPSNVNLVFERLVESTGKYLILAEYFSRELCEIPYRGEKDLLWKMDFGKNFLKYSGWKVLSYGFLWGYEFDDCGFDDVTYWVFERN
jgi:spore coat polysaccharide biosynthesis protein SpsF